MSHASNFIPELCLTLETLGLDAIERMAQILSNLNGRLFVCGIGGSAANASHAVNDFRKLCGIEAYAPTDNVAELTARTNDEGWSTIFREWLITSKATPNDVVLFLSVGGGTPEVSENIISAVDYAASKGIKVLGIVGRDGGYVKRRAACVVHILPPSAYPEWITPFTESVQSVVLHLLCSHPLLQVNKPKW